MGIPLLLLSVTQSHPYQSGMREILARDGDSRVTYIERITEVMEVDLIIQGKCTERGVIGTKDECLAPIPAVQRLLLHPISS